ncbi:hypothetical protein MVES_002857 [Malassezia vespertilionis]|uniref:DNA-directed RNA polymerase RBP11-like dimerisation domain-containing protein n=1 Tax=Malassezia vespertilionis TaxID=2020962 RepID=A0A2N1J9I6_9BASI|nr:hypothetical protein MVES_002857 [Malassezia vespertilionis]
MPDASANVIPHPSESKVHIRVQMVENTVSAVQAFAEALSNLYGLLETVQEEYTASLTDGQFERTETKPIPVSLRKEFSG